MSEYLDKLLSISSVAMSNTEVSLTEEFLQIAGKLSCELLALLGEKNGFYTFESALRFFPSSSSELSIGLNEWNNVSLWRQDYKGLADDCLFFAEDIFGGQFCIKNEMVCLFEPETGEIEEIALNLEDWSKEILAEYNVLTGYPLAQEWQKLNGKLANNVRLMPKIPFVCGGQYDVDNLVAINAVSGMRTRANLARQIIDLPDGSEIEFKVVE